MKCGRCEADLPEEAIFCMQCGVQVREMPPELAKRLAVSEGQLAPATPTAPPSFWHYPDVREAVLKFLNEQVPKLVSQRMSEGHETIRSAVKWELGITVGVVIVVIAPAAWLASQGRMSADAVTFLYGVVVGAVFGFLRDVFPNAN